MDKLIISGKVVAIFPTKRGSLQNGETWESQGILIETEEKFPTKIYLEIFGAQKIEEFGVEKGKKYNFYLNIASKEFSGKWYTNLKAWMIRPYMEDAAKADEDAAKPKPVINAPTVDKEMPIPTVDFDDDGDMPF